MTRILILYATVEGHTGRIAQRIASRLRDKGHTVKLLRAGAGGAGPPLEFAAFDAAIVGASIHYGRHPGHLRALVRAQRAALAQRPGAFFSVSLSAGGPGAKPEAAQRYLETFLRQTGWRPQMTASFAGALQYCSYGAFKRWLMMAFVSVAGGDTDASMNHEYTDWDAVDRFADAFASLPGAG